MTGYDCSIYLVIEKMTKDSSSDTETSTFFSGDHATQQTLGVDHTELRTVQISIKGLAISTLGAEEK